MAMSYNAADYLDKTTILACCDQIDADAVDYTTMATSMRNASESLGKDVLSVEGETIQPLIENYASQISQVKDYIKNFTDNIREQTTTAYDQLQKRLDQLEEEARQKAQADENANKS